jgi:hypothetical protein
MIFQIPNSEFLILNFERGIFFGWSNNFELPLWLDQRLKKYVEQYVKFRKLELVKLHCVIINNYTL